MRQLKTAHARTYWRLTGEQELLKQQAIDGECKSWEWRLLIERMRKHGMLARANETQAMFERIKLENGVE